MYYPILMIPVGVGLTYAICYFCMKHTEDEKDKAEKIERIERIFKIISSENIINTLNNQSDFRIASLELDKKLLNIIKKEK
jgi:hypothetical protein